MLHFHRFSRPKFEKSKKEISAVVHSFYYRIFIYCKLPPVVVLSTAAFVPNEGMFVDEKELDGNELSEMLQIKKLA